MTQVNNRAQVNRSAELTALLEANGEIKIVGAIYAVETGKVSYLGN